MRTIVFAYHEIGAAALRATLRNGLDVVAVFTHRDDPNEGGWYASVARLAAEHGIPVHAPDKLDHPIWIERIKAMKPELLLSYHYRNLIPKAVRGLFPAGCLNLHSSLLPKHRGRCPINWVLVLGEKETGVTLHHMADKADAGDEFEGRDKNHKEVRFWITSLHKKCRGWRGILYFRPSLREHECAADDPQNHVAVAEIEIEHSGWACFLNCWARLSSTYYLGLCAIASRLSRKCCPKRRVRSENGF